MFPFFCIAAFIMLYHFYNRWRLMAILKLIGAELADAEYVPGLLGASVRGFYEGTRIVCEGSYSPSSSFSNILKGLPRRLPAPGTDRWENPGLDNGFILQPPYVTRPIVFYNIIRLPDAQQPDYIHGELAQCVAACQQVEYSANEA